MISCGYCFLCSVSYLNEFILTSAQCSHSSPLTSFEFRFQIIESLHSDSTSIYQDLSRNFQDPQSMEILTKLQ